MSNAIAQHAERTVRAVLEDTLSLPAEVFGSFETYYFLVRTAGRNKGKADAYSCTGKQNKAGLALGRLADEIRKTEYRLDGENYLKLAEEPEVLEMIHAQIDSKKTSTVLKRAQREENGVGIMVFHAFSRDQIINQIFKNGYLQELIYFSMREGEVNRRIGRSELNSSMIATGAARSYVKERNLISPDRLSQISAVTYETEECIGKIAFADSENRLVVSLKERGNIYTHNLKLLRKYLEMTKGEEDLSLLVDTSPSHNVLGLGNPEEREEAYTIEVKGAFNWVVRKGGRDELEYKQGKYIIHSNYGTDAQITKTLDGIFDENVDVQNLVGIIQEVKNQERGAMLIISRDARNEAKRLCDSKRGIAVEPFALRAVDRAGRNLIRSITTIDGAVVMDEKGICYAIGVILDGKINYMSAKYSDTGRGARFNSAISYVFDSKYLTVAVIVSDDQYFNIVSNRDFNFEDMEKTGE